MRRHLARYRSPTCPRRTSSTGTRCSSTWPRASSGKPGGRATPYARACGLRRSCSKGVARRVRGAG
eukprot:15444000-Alexandrium_andersonii.AAC.1